MPRIGHRKWTSRVRAWLLESPPTTSRGISVAALLILVLLDYMAPRYITFGTFYLVLIAYTSWVLDRRSGWLVALIAIGASIGINGFGMFASVAAGPSREAAIVWNILMRLLSSAFVIELVRSFRNSFNYERRLGTTDPLTGILNRRAFLDTVSGRLPRVGARGRTAIVAYLDLDGFKPVNDRYGHAAGDEVLVHFADALVGAVRRYDCAGRSGGDEFLLFLDVPSQKTGERVVLRLHREIEAQLETLPYGKVSCSMGAVIVPAGHPLPAIDTLISQADSLMYQAKARGLKRLRIAS
ncbi:MAG TPA: GGDEF domain-containing protein, partial [Sphingomonas sp.]|nr:GGDEF domain-containing protein [Sphingomonas sp.]